MICFSRSGRVSIIAPAESWNLQAAVTPPAILISDSSAIGSKTQKLMTTNPGIGVEEFVGFLTSPSPTDASTLDRLIDHARAMSRTDLFEDDSTMIEIEFT